MDIAKFVEDFGPVTVVFENTTAKFFAWSGKDRDNPGCNVRVWHRGQQVSMGYMPQEAREEYGRILQIVGLK